MEFLGQVVVGIAKLKVIWKAWDVRSFVVASFLFQIFLILISPFRKRTPSFTVRISTWIAYLLADWVAAQAVGLIAKVTQISDSAETDLFGLWAQFLLLHLGGPDTITALALEDNELWLRTALHLGTLAYATLGILVRSVKKSTLWIATVLMFFAGVIKYLERVRSLNNGRLLDIVQDPYEKYMTNYNEDGENEEEQNPWSNNALMVRFSYRLFQAYKSIYSDIQPDSKVIDNARDSFLTMTPDEAYKMVEIQLNFTYEAMYTKMAIMHKTLWRVFRLVVLFLQVASFVIWFLWNKRNFQGYDVGITYAMLIGAIIVDLVGFVRVQLSDWNVALHKQESFSNKIISTCDLVTFNASRTCRDLWSWLLNAHLSRNRWSIHIGRYDGQRNYCGSTLINYLAKKLGLEDSLQTRGLVKFDPEISSKWCFIFEMLTKPDMQQSYELSGSGVTSTINDLLLQALPIHIMDYSLVLQFWFQVTRNMENYRNFQGPEDMCCDLSKYLIYLISFQPNMMYGSAGKTMVEDRKQGIILFSDVPQLQSNYKYEEEEIVNDRKENGIGLLTFESERGSGGQSYAARQMKEVGDYVIAENKRDVLARIWGELVCHAAITCKPKVHAEKLKEGGQFLTFVWLLMVHLGIKARTLS